MKDFISLESESGTCFVSVSLSLVHTCTFSKIIIRVTFRCWIISLNVVKFQNWQSILVMFSLEGCAYGRLWVSPARAVHRAGNYFTVEELGWEIVSLKSVPVFLQAARISWLFLFIRAFTKAWHHLYSSDEVRISSSWMMNTGSTLAAELI